MLSRFLGIFLLGLHAINRNTCFLWMFTVPRGEWWILWSQFTAFSMVVLTFLWISSVGIPLRFYVFFAFWLPWNSFSLFDIQVYPPVLLLPLLLLLLSLDVHPPNSSYWNHYLMSRCHYWGAVFAIQSEYNFFKINESLSSLFYLNWRWAYGL